MHKKRMNTYGKQCQKNQNQDGITKKDLGFMCMKT